MELNMKTKNLLGMAHSQSEVVNFLLKFVMTSASVFINTLNWSGRGPYTRAGGTCRAVRAGGQGRPLQP